MLDAGAQWLKTRHGPENESKTYVEIDIEIEMGVGGERERRRVGKLIVTNQIKCFEEKTLWCLFVTPKCNNH